MVGLTENIQACLRDFLAGTASMARKRHLASTARGLLCFCLMALVTTGLICSIRPIRGRNKPILWRTALQADVWWCVMNPRVLPPVTHGSALQAPERMWRPIRGREETSRGWGISVFIQLTQDFPGEQRNGGNNLPIGKTGKTFAASDLCTIFAPQKREDC